MADKLIAMSTLIEWGKELRFQSEQQMQAVYERMPGIEIVRCKDCQYKYIDGTYVQFNCCEKNHNVVQSDDWFCADGREPDQDD